MARPLAFPVREDGTLPPVTQEHWEQAVRECANETDLQPDIEPIPGCGSAPMVNALYRDAKAVGQRFAAWSRCATRSILIALSLIHISEPTRPY